MSTPLTMLVLPLIGAGLVLIALVVMLGRRSRGSGRRTTLVPVAAVLLGVGLTVASWMMRPLGPPPGDDAIEHLLDGPPTAAGKVEPRFGHVRILVNSTPSDRGDASPSARHAYSSQLATLLANATAAAGLAGRVDAQATNQVTSDLTDFCRSVDLVVTLNMPAIRLPERKDYALWREPELELHWCGTGRVQTQKFRVLERPGDALPYEQAVRNRLLAALRTAPAH